MHDEERGLRRALAWFDVGGRKLGTWAFALNRLTGLALMLYLLLHLGVLTLLALGEAQWDAFIALSSAVHCGSRWWYWKTKPIEPLRNLAASSAENL